MCQARVVSELTATVYTYLLNLKKKLHITQGQKSKSTFIGHLGTYYQTHL